MSLWSRMKLVFKSGLSSALDRAEDPRHVLDNAYGQQQELLITLRRGLVAVATAKEQLEQQALRLQTRIPRLDDQARRAVAAGRHDLARLALERKQLAMAQRDGLYAQVAEVEADEHRLAGEERTLQVRIEEFRTHREVVSAGYSAAEAEAQMKDALHRAAQTTEQARAAAIDCLVRDGDLESINFVLGSDAMDSRLRSLAADADLDKQLDALRWLDR